MTQAAPVFSVPDPAPPVRLGTIGPVMAIWFAVILAIALNGGFDLNVAGLPYLTIAAILVPPAAFTTGLLVSPKVRAFALSLDPGFVTSLQSWRIVGAMFVALYAFNQLPGLFAWPAGVGDALVGLAAPFVVWRLLKAPQSLGTRRFRMFHYSGMFDFVVAVSTGIIAREHIPGLVEGATSAAMGQFPLTMIPTFFVPMFTILHIIALYHSFRAERGEA